MNRFAQNANRAREGVRWYSLALERQEQEIYGTRRPAGKAILKFFLNKESQDVDFLIEKIFTLTTERKDQNRRFRSFYQEAFETAMSAAKITTLSTLLEQNLLHYSRTLNFKRTPIWPEIDAWFEIALIYLNRGVLRDNLYDVKGAVSDFSAAISLDKNLKKHPELYKKWADILENKLVIAYSKCATG